MINDTKTKCIQYVIFLKRWINIERKNQLNSLIYGQEFVCEEISLTYCDPPKNTRLAQESERKVLRLQRLSTALVILDLLKLYLKLYATLDIFKWEDLQ